MPIDIISADIDVNKKREHVVLTDDYGSDYHLYVPVSAAAQRQTLINNAIALMQANQTSMESYAAAHAIDLSAQKTAGLAKKAALLAKLPAAQAATLKVVTAAAQAAIASAPASSSTPAPTA